MGGAGLLVKEEPPISGNTGDGKFSPRKQFGCELLSKKKRQDTLADAGFVKDGADDDYAGVSLDCFLDLAERHASIEPVAKRMKLSALRPKAFNVESTMKHVADIVLVLAGLGLIRAGRDPTQEERRLQAEAYGHLGFLVQKLDPRDLVSQGAVENLIENLGLRKPEDQEVKTFEQILEEFQPPATIQMVDPPRIGMDAVSTERSMEDLDPQKFLLSASRYGANDDDQLQSELIEGEVSPSEQKEGEASGSHTQFTQAIQDLLQPKYPADYPFQAAHSRIFMNAAMPCEMCKVTVKETVNVLVCDTCEKVFHLRCLQSYLLTGIPKGDWHCPKCSEESKEKNQAPKYGRVKAGFSFSDASGLMGKSSTKSLPNVQKTKQPAISADGKSTKEARDKVAPATRKLDDAAPDSSKASHKTLNHGNLGGSFTALLDSFAQGESHNSANLLKGGRPANHTPSTHPQTTTRSAFLRSQAGESPTMVPSKPQSHGGRGAAKVAGEGMQAKKTAEIQSASSLPPDPNGAGNGGKQSNSVEESESLDENDPSVGSGEEAECPKPGKETDRFGIEWVGDVVHKSDGKKFYSACTVGGYLYRLQDCALFRPETPNVPPYIARLQALWEEISSGSKWVRVNWCYYPADMAMLPGRPPNPEVHEVYESNHGDNNLVGTIQGQCLVLQPESYAKEMERRQELLKGGSSGEGLVPIFLCRWLYDVATATFRPTTGAP